jgi:O-antigen/teichoic acid export membrane protein
MRTKNSIRNIITVLIGQIFGILITFISRMVFIRILGAEYLGVNGLFTNILSLLSLAEMGFGSAIIYSLYKPLAAKDEIKIKALMNFYASAYHLIGIVVLGIGLLLFPFLDYIIKDKPDIPNISIIYILYLANSVITYFFAYKRSLIIADQKNHIVTIYKYSFYTIVNIIQIIVLLTTKNFIFFLLVQFVFGFIENFMISRKAEKLYPFLKKSKGVKLDKVSKREIFKNVQAMMYHRLGGVVVAGTDNIIISSFVGIVWVGLYSNYLLIITAINTIIGQVFVSVTASVGNLNTLEDKSKSLIVYKSILLANFWLFGLSTISLFILFNPFITLWVGKEFLMSESIVVMIVINFYVNGMRKTTLMFRDSLGLFWNDRYKPVFESIINLIASVFLAKQYGIFGVLLGTFISTMTTCFWIEPYILYKYGFNNGVKDYFIRYGKYSFVLLIASIVTWLSCSIFSTVTVLNIVGRLLICLLVPNIIFLVFFYKTHEFKYLYKIVTDLFGKYFKIFTR